MNENNKCYDVGTLVGILVMLFILFIELVLNHWFHLYSDI